MKIPATEGHALGESAAVIDGCARSQVAVDSPLEEAGFELSVPPERCGRHINPSRAPCALGSGPELYVPFLNVAINRGPRFNIVECQS
jgi:hypothetical protein